MPSFSFPLLPDWSREACPPDTSPFDYFYRNLIQNLPDNFEGNGDYLNKVELGNVAFYPHTRLLSGVRNEKRIVIFQVTEKDQTTDTVERIITCAIHDRYRNDQKFQAIAYSTKSCPLIKNPIFWGKADQYCNTFEMSNLCEILKGRIVVVEGFAYELYL